MKPGKYKARPGTWVVTLPAKFSKDGKRENHYFKSLNAAKEWISQFKAEHAEHGMAYVTGEDRQWINYCRGQIGDLSLLPKILHHWKATGPDSITPTTVSDTVNRFLSWRPNQGRWNPSTAEDTISRLSAFKEAFLNRFIHELTPADLQDFLASRGTAGTQAKYFNKIRPVFRYAKLHRFLATNPLENIQAPTVEYQEIEIYKPTEMAAMLKVAEELYPDLAPFLALMAFGFMRTEELIPRFDGDPVLEWSAFDWSDNRIFVPHPVAKKLRSLTSNERSIPLNPTLVHWLKPYVKHSGRIVTRRKLSAYRALAKIRIKAEARDIANGIRHSCLTYWMAANGEESVGTVARWSGNSEAVAKKHYIATVKRLEGKAWFGLRR